MMRVSVYLSFFLFFSTIISPLFSVDHIAVTLKVNENVILTRNDSTYPVQKGDILFNGDLLETGSNSFAAIQFNDNNSLVKLFPNSSLKIEAKKDYDKLNKKCKLAAGKIWARISKDKGDFEIETSTTVVSVKGTEFLVAFQSNGDTDIYTFKGNVFIRNKIDDLIGTASAGEHAQTSGSGIITISEFNTAELPAEIIEFLKAEIEPLEPQEKSSQPQQTLPSSPESVLPENKTHSAPEAASSSSEKPSQGISMGGSVGTTLMNGEIYTRVSFMPELIIGKFGIGLDIELLIDGDGKIRKEDWDDFEDYLAKILYLRYGHRGDPVFGKIGGFYDYTLGHGLVMKDYTNMLYYPDMKQIGLQLGGRLPVANITLEGFTSNLFKNEILAGRLTIQPLLESELPLLNHLILGTTIAHDRNQFKGLMDSDGDNYPDIFDDFPYNDKWHNQVDHDIDIFRNAFLEWNPDASEDDFLEWFYSSETLNSLRNPSFQDLGKDYVTVFGLDYELPLYSSKLFYLSHYGEFAQIAGHNNGFIFPGFYSRFLIFDLKLEFRHYEEDFLPSFFDYLYDAERTTVTMENDTSYVLTTKEMLVPLSPEASGWYASLTTNLFNFLYVTVSYEDMYGKKDYRNKSIWGNVRLEQRIIPNLATAEIKYGQTNFDKLTAIKAPSAFIEGKLGYSIIPSTQLIGSYKERYIDLNNNGRIKGKDETVKTMSLGVEFRF